MKRFLLCFLLLCCESIFFPHYIEIESIFSVLFVSLVTSLICMGCEDIFYGTLVSFSNGGVRLPVLIFTALSCFFGSTIISFSLCDALIKGFEINGIITFCILVVQTSFLYFLSKIRVEVKNSAE